MVAGLTCDIKQMKRSFDPVAEIIEARINVQQFISPLLLSSNVNEGLWNSDGETAHSLTLEETQWLPENSNDDCSCYG